MVTVNAEDFVREAQPPRELLLFPYPGMLTERANPITSDSGQRNLDFEWDWSSTACLSAYFAQSTM